ncbi:hypothetical protein ACOSQ2_010602 [Xanthoceras sorbifolium]
MDGLFSYSAPLPIPFFLVEENLKLLLHFTNSFPVRRIHCQIEAVQLLALDRYAVSMLTCSMPPNDLLCAQDLAQHPVWTPQLNLGPNELKQQYLMRNGGAADEAVDVTVV